MRILLLHSSSDLYGASKIFLQTVTLLRKQGSSRRIARPQASLTIKKFLEEWRMTTKVFLNINKAGYTAK